jgi:hypothetical protein
MYSNEQISKFRAEVIERTINIEGIIEIIISQHFFKKVNEDFILKVLYDSYFSFGLKIKILENIIVIDKKKMSKLKRIDEIRNHFAHRNRLFYKRDNPLEEGVVVDPKDNNKAINFEKLYEEFTKLSLEIEEYLLSIYKDIGGLLLSKDEYLEYIKSLEHTRDDI